MEKFDDLCRKCLEAERRQFSLEPTGNVEESKAEITSLIRKFLSEDGLLALWSAVLREDGEEITASASVGEFSRRTSALDLKADVYRLLSGHRIISNCYMSLGKTLGDGNSTDEGEDFSKEKYLRMILAAFTDAVSVHCNIQDERSSSLVGTFLEWFPREAHMILVEVLCSRVLQDEAKVQAFAALLPERWVFETMRQLLRLGKHRQRSHPSRMPGLMNLLGMLLRLYLPIADHDISATRRRTARLCEELCLKRPYDATIAECIVKNIPMEGTALLLAMHEVCALWSQSIFVRRGDVPMQGYLTQLLLAGMSRLSRDTNQDQDQGSNDKGGGDANAYDMAGFLYRTGPRGVSLLVSLSQGVSAYLDCAEPQCRLNGMRVARAFSAVTGHSLSFPELEEADRLDRERERERERAEARVGGKGKKKEHGWMKRGFLLTPDSRDQAGQAEEVEKSPNSSDRATTMARTLEEEEEAQFEAYDLGEEPPVEDPEHYSSSEQRGGVEGAWERELAVHGGQTNYLRSCLLMLRVDHSKPEACAKHRIALVNLPRIVAARPPDGVILAPPVVMELVKAGNHFNQEDFDQLRGRALMAVLVNYPSVAISTLSRCVEASDFALGTRLYATKALGQVAFQLAGINSPEVGAGTEWFTQEPEQEQDRGKGKGKEVDHSIAHTAEGRGKSKGKSSVFRPRKLALSLTREERMRQARSSQAKGGGSSSNSSSAEGRGLTRNLFGPVSHLVIGPLLRVLGRHAHASLGGAAWAADSALGNSNSNSSSSGGGDGVHSPQTFRLSETQSTALLLPSSSSPSRRQEGPNPWVRELDQELGNSDTRPPVQPEDGDGDVDVDSVRFLLVADSLFTLGSAVRCTHNTPSFRRSVEAVLPAATAPVLRDHAVLLVRRAALVAVYMCLEAWGMQRRARAFHEQSGGGGGGGGGSRNVIGSMRGAGALETLRNLVGTTLAQEDPLLGDTGTTGGGINPGGSNDPFQVDPELGQLTAEYVDWCLAGVQEDPDEVCRALRLEVVRAAVALDGDEC